MKTLMSICMLYCITAIPASGQGGSFAPLGATWTYTFADHFPFTFTYRPFVTTVSAVEMYQGRLCSRLPLDKAQGTGSNLDFWILDTLYIHEANDSVFFWSPISEQFQLLYDFTAGVGDSWEVGGLLPDGFGDIDDFLTVTIDSITTQVVNGDTLRVWHHAFSMYFDWGNQIIEGIGSNGFMVPSFGLFESRLGTLRCYEEPLVEWQFVSYACDTVIGQLIGSVGDPSRDQRTITLTPNPVTDFLQISLDDEVGRGKLWISDLHGQLQYYQEMMFPCAVNTGHLPAGVYIVQVTMGSRSLSSARLVKLP